MFPPLFLLQLSLFINSLFSHIVTRFVLHLLQICVCVCFRVFLCSDLLSLVIRFKLLFRSFSLSCSPNRAHLHKTYHRFLFPLSFARALSLSITHRKLCRAALSLFVCVCVCYSTLLLQFPRFFFLLFAPLLSFFVLFKFTQFFFSYGNIIYFIHKKKEF